jgi:hypothetical protein
MVAAITEVKARARLRKHKLEPAGPYPGGVLKPWQLTCLLCGMRVTESLNKVEKRSRPGCEACCAVGNRLTEKQATQRLRDHSFRELEPYPGTVGSRWRVECELCGAETETTLAFLQKRKHPGCVECGTRAHAKSRTTSETEAKRRARKEKLTPLEQYPGNSRKPWRCRCQVCGNTVAPTLNKITTGPGCRYCGVEEGRRKLRVPEKTAAAEMRAAGVKPLAPYPGAMRSWPGRCLTCHNETRSTLASVRQGRSACRHCARQSIATKRLAKSRGASLRVMRKAGLEPVGEYTGSTRPWKSKCITCGQISSPRPKDVRNGHGCRYCASNAQWNSRKAASVARQANREYLEPFQGASTPIRMRCTRCGNEVTQAPSVLIEASGYCQRCKPTARFTPEEAVELMRAAGMEPLTPYEAARKPWPALCLKCNTEGAPRLGSIRAGQRGCRVCGNYGYDVRKPTTLYVLVNREHAAIKVGITNTGSVRLKQLARVGWKPGRLYEFEEGITPLRVETLLLRHLRQDLMLQQAVTQTQMRGVGGATETFHNTDVTTRYIYARITALIKD